MANLLNIYYMLIGDVTSKSILYELTLERTGADLKAKEIFTRVTNLKSYINVIGQKNKIPSSDANSFYYFYVTIDGALIFVEADRSFSQTLVYRFIDTLVKENVHLMTNDNGELNKNGKIIIKSMLAEYQENEVEETEGAIEEVIIKESARRLTILGRRADFRILEGNKADKASKIKATCGKNMKMIAVTVAIGIVLLIVIILPVILSQLAVPNVDSVAKSNNSTLNSSAVGSN
jgi:hypothetical protein